jgi:A/G-specific adenine glycosylase
MLQQTQVSTVLDYYPRFLQKFPSVQALAQAPLDEVLGLWSGLGYYSRARHLHRCAQEVVAKWQGQFPASALELQTLPGIGPSTAAAIAAFCWGERVSIFDGNVQRVLSRFLGFVGDMSVLAEQKKLNALAQGLVPENAEPQEMVSYTQGLMDLGAMVCMPRRSDCSACPLSGDCVAHSQDRVLHYPLKSKRLKRSVRRSHLLWLCGPQGVWLVRRPEQGVWAGLYAMPLLEEGAVAQDSALTPAWPADASLERLPPIKHVLTHFDWHLDPWRVELRRSWSTDQVRAHLSALRWPEHALGRWVAHDVWPELGLPAPIRTLLQSRILA